MEPTLANIRRACAVAEVPWVRWVVTATGLLTGEEVGRLALQRGVAWPVAVAVGLGLAAAGWLAARRVARSVLTGARERELIYRFGFGLDLLEACAAAPALAPEAEAALDAALSHLRRLEALANQDDWDELAGPTPSELADEVELTLILALAAPDAAELARLAAELGELADGVMAALAALRHGLPDEAAAAWREAQTAGARLAGPA